MEEPPGFQEATFHVVHNDGVVYVVIRGDEAIVVVNKIRDIEVVVRAINRAASCGVTHGTLFTGDVVNLGIVRKHGMRADEGVTWLGGKVTRMSDGPEGDPRFRIDWDVFPSITV